MKVYLMRVRTLTWQTPVWILFDKDHMVRGGPKVNRIKMLTRWRNEYGAITELVRFKGTASPAEAACSIVEIQKPMILKPKKKE